MPDGAFFLGGGIGTLVGAGGLALFLLIVYVGRKPTRR